MCFPSTRQCICMVIISACSTGSTMVASRSAWILTASWYDKSQGIAFVADNLANGLIHCHRLQRCESGIPSVVRSLLRRGFHRHWPSDDAVDAHDFLPMPHFGGNEIAGVFYRA